MLLKQTHQTNFTRKNSININGNLIDLGTASVMGVLNVTPDSFYDGGRYTGESAILSRTEKMLSEGAKFIDIGALSTRPGAEEISIDEELGRLRPVFDVIKKRFPEAFISLDTYRSRIAKTIVREYGSCIINDISGGTMDDRMFETVADLKVPYVLMHIQGTPQTMQKNPFYSDVVNDIILTLTAGVEKLKILGVNDVIIDPGFGFGKSQYHNFDLINRLDSFKIFGLPLMVGVSRKAMIWRSLEITPDESLNGTTVLNTLALLGGADILRVHDVKEAIETIKLVNLLLKSIKKEQ